MLIADEVQTGFGRTGTLFAIEQSGVEPDLVCVAKSIAGGLPLSGVFGRAEIMDAPGDSAIGGTYVGNPVACVAALAVLEEIDRLGPVRARARDRRGADAAHAQPAGARAADRRRTRPRLHDRPRVRARRRARASPRPSWRRASPSTRCVTASSCSRPASMAT